MAKNYQDIYNSVFVTGNKMDWTNAMIRGNGIPLDIYSVFDSYDKAVQFAATNAVAYEGQILAVTENEDTTVYVITPAKQGTVIINEVETDIYLKEVGTATLGDDKTIVLNDGVLSLKNFGVEYYAYDDEAKAWKTEVTKGWVEGLQPKVINSGTTDSPVYEIAWFEPSSTTVEGLSESVGTLTERIATAEGTITTQARLISDNATAIENLDEDKADRATTLAGYGITDAYTKEEVNGLISGAFHFRGEVNYYSDLTSKTDMLEGDVYVVKYIGTEGEIPLNAEYAYDGEKWVEFGSVIDLSGYATKVELGEVRYDIDAINDETTGILATAKKYTDDREVEIRKDITSNADEIADLKTADETNLQIAKDYANDLNTAMDTRVSANTIAIEVINNETTGILATAKSYTDTRETEIRKDITANANEIADLKTADETNLQTAKDYTNDLNTAMDTRVSANTEAIDGINAEIATLKTTDTENLAEAKSYTDEEVAKNKILIDTNTSDIANLKIADETNLGVAKDYTDAEVGGLKSQLDGVSGRVDIMEVTTIPALQKTDTDNLATAKAYADEIGQTLSESINTQKIILEQSDTDNLATAKAYTDEQVATVAFTAANAMKYKGTVGVGGTVEKLPTTGVTNGDTYKVLVSGIYDNQQASVGDVFIAVVTTTEDTATISWTLIPAGDDGNVSTPNSEFGYHSIIVGTGTGTEVTSLGYGSYRQILRTYGDSDGMYWDNETVPVVESSDNSVSITSEAHPDDVTVNVKYDLSIKSISTDLLVQGSEILVFDGGNSSFNVSVEPDGNSGQN